MEHKLKRIDVDGYRGKEKYQCEVCGRYWQSEPRSKCAGVKLYSWGNWGELKTKKQLSESGYQTGKNLPKPAGACLRAESPNGFMYLYDPADAVPKRTSKNEV